MAHMNNKIYIPSRCHKDWRPLLAKPDRQWKKGKSAMELAIRWQYSEDFPESVKKTFKNSGIPLFQNIEILFAFPEYKVPIPPLDARPSQNDVYVIAKACGKLISIMVEGKTDERFDDNVSKWIKKAASDSGKPERLKFLLGKLGLIGLKEEEINKIPYQLLHRTYSAIYGADLIFAKDALMLVHSFSEKDSHFEDFAQFAQLFELSAQKDLIVGPKKLSGIDLYFGWVKENSPHCSEKYYPCEME